jgi:hypothetical protein
VTRISYIPAGHYVPSTANYSGVTSISGFPTKRLNDKEAESLLLDDNSSTGFACTNNILREVLRKK